MQKIYEEKTKFITQRVDYFRQSLKTLKNDLEFNESQRQLLVNE